MESRQSITCDLGRLSNAVGGRTQVGHITRERFAKRSPLHVTLRAADDVPSLRLPRPTATPRTWLLATGWRRHGLLGFDEVPGTSRTEPRS